MKLTVDEIMLKMHLYGWRIDPNRECFVHEKFENEPGGIRPFSDAPAMIENYEELFNRKAADRIEIFTQFTHAEDEMSCACIYCREKFKSLKAPPPSVTKTKERQRWNLAKFIREGTDRNRIACHAYVLEGEDQGRIPLKMWRASLSITTL